MQSQLAIYQLWKSRAVALTPQETAELIGKMLAKAKLPVEKGDMSNDLVNLCCICQVCFLLGQGKKPEDISEILGFDCTKLVDLGKELVSSVRPAKVRRRPRHVNFEPYIATVLDRSRKRPDVLDPGYDEMVEAPSGPEDIGADL